MSKYQLGYAMCAEGLPCARPSDAEFSAGWCDALYTMTERGELHEVDSFPHAGEFDEMYADCQELDDIGRNESLQAYLY